MLNFIFKTKAKGGRWTTETPFTKNRGTNQKCVCIDTGLKDSTGRNIFTGDIIETGDGERFLIMLHPDEPSVVGLSDFSFRHSRNTVYSGPTRLAKMSKNTKVIGNIHDKPELFTENAKKYEPPKK